VTVITDPLFYALAIPAVTALGLSKGGFAGVGQMATPLLALVMPPLEAAAVMLPIMILQDSVALWVYRKDWDAGILKIMLPGALVGIGLAWLLAAYVSDAAVRVFIGVAAMAFAIYSWVNMVRLPRVQPKAGVTGGVLLGAAAGFTSTLCQVGGPPFQIYLLAQRLPKMTFVGTSAVFFASLNWLKVVPYLQLGQFSAKGFMTSLVLVPLALLTNQLGFWLVRRVSQELFFRLTLAAMAVIGIELLRSGVTDMLRG
jgi:uncharacterized membrane protein YfcA